MDLSKLPKMSKTPPPPAAETESMQPQAGEPQGTGRADSQRREMDEPLPGFAEAWISIALGAILLFVFPNTLEFLFSRASFDANHSFLDTAGNPTTYTKTAFFWADMGVTLFAAVLIAEGIVLAMAKKPGLVLAAMILTIGAGAFNLIVVVCVNHLIGFQIVCALAVAVAGYMAATQWRLVEVLRRREMGRS